MEDIYFFIFDCVHNLSSLFTFNPLISLSTTSKYNSSTIYELSIHDHDKFPIYYASINQLKKFHKINTLTISKYFSYENHNFETYNITYTIDKFRFLQ